VNRRSSLYWSITADREDLDTIVLVGKGITFDTGGISLKPVANMGAMKSDMGGAAAVLGTMNVVGALDLPLRVIGITPCTENMPDAYAYRPADVITAGNGKTIEIISTDAEGRMVLADALVYAQGYHPDAVIDLATLTGSCVIALGQDMAAGLFSTADNLRDRLVAAGETTRERVWPLPLWDDYRQAIDSDVADMKNSGGRFGGVATSAIFLKEFTDYPWAHLDIAGMALTEKGNPYIPRGGTGFGVRLLDAIFAEIGSRGFQTASANRKGRGIIARPFLYKTGSHPIFFHKKSVFCISPFFPIISSKFSGKRPSTIDSLTVLFCKFKPGALLIYMTKS
jgi:leucyl aminopeptidase